MSMRAEIKACLDTVAGVTGYEWVPTVVRPGDAFPTRGPLDRQDGHTFFATWTVVVIVPADPRKAEEWFENNYADVFLALLPVGIADSIEPGFMQMGSDDVPAMLITITTGE
jgi:hypothetical protein